jgi:predicted acetyltransferase
MTNQAYSPSAHINVLPAAREQQPIVANLLELYAHDFSEFHHLDLGVDGKFGYRDLALYWSEPNRYPFLVSVDGRWAGLVLVKRGSEVSGHAMVWDMAEFFVARAYRRRGVGTEIACQIWRQFTGAWEIRVMESNQAALQFWARTIDKFAGDTVRSVRVEKDDRRWHLFSFESSCAT